MTLRARTCCFLLTCLTFQAYSQATAQLEADSTRVETGNPYVLHLSIMSSTTPDSLNFKPWGGVFEYKNFLSQTPWTRNGKLLSSDISLIFFDADTITLPPLAVTFSGTDTLFSNPFDLIIYATPSPDDLNDMAPIKDISREETLWTDYLPIAAIVIGAFLLIWLVFWWYKRSKQVSSRSRTLEHPPHELALKKLDILQKKSLWKQGAVKTYCAELTFILREYLEKRYQVRALESTSEELLAQLQHTDFPVELRADLGNVLSQADLVKFAKAIPPDEFYQYSMDFALALVNSTIPVPEPETSVENQNAQ